MSLDFKIESTVLSDEQGTANGRASVMAQLSKDTVEVTASIESRAQNKPIPQRKGTSAHVRADAVSLEVAVKVHGSRPASPSSAQTERFEEQTSTMIVFAKGGVLRMTTPVTSGQMLVVTNLKSRQDAICRVVNVRSFPNMQSYVEVEFTQPQPGYWGVHFSSETTPGAPSSSAKPSIPPEKETSLDRPPEATDPSPALRKTLAPRPAVPPTEPSPKPVPTASPSSYARPGSTFVAIGMREEVQPAASATSIDHSPRTGPELEGAPKNDARKRPVFNASTEEAGSENRLLARSTETPDADEIDRAIRALGGLGPRSTLAVDRTATADSFGTRLGRETEQITSPAGHRKWVLVAACAGLALAAVTGGVWYFRHSAATVTTAQGLEAKPAPAAVPPNTASNPSPPAAPSEPTSSALTPQSAPVEPSKPPAEKAEVVSTKGKLKEESRAQTEAHGSSDNRTAVSKDEEVPAKPPAPGGSQASEPASGPALAPQANAHPLWSEHAVDTAQVPSVEAPAQTGPGELPGVDSSGVALPPPPGDTPVRVGGKIKEPQLISNAVPAYPELAKQAHVEGDVVVETEIDKTGAVARMKVISGPMALRSAALDALRQWKYKPSLLDGQPVAVEMLVTIKFRL